MVGRRPSPEQLEIISTVVVLSEAKKENLMGGIAQWIAEMVAAQVFNDRSNNDIPIIYGAVTSVTNWQFLTLQGTQVNLDTTEYFISDVNHGAAVSSLSRVRSVFCGSRGT